MNIASAYVGPSETQSGRVPACSSAMPKQDSPSLATGPPSSPLTPSSSIMFLNASGGASLPATPLAQRQWHKEAQRTTRLALTNFKGCCTRFQGVSKSAYAQATELTNSLLTDAYLEGMPLGALGTIPGFHQQARAKLRANQARLLHSLEVQVGDLCSIALQMVNAIGSLQCLLVPNQPQEGPGSSIKDVPPSTSESAPSGALQSAGASCMPLGGALEASDACGGSAVTGGHIRSQVPSQPESVATWSVPAYAPAWQVQRPVFAFVPLPRVIDMFQTVAELYLRELSVKERLFRSFQAVFASHHGLAASAGEHPVNVERGKGSADELRQQLTVHLATWMLNPDLNPAVVDQHLAVLTDEMVGF